MLTFLDPRLQPPKFHSVFLGEEGTFTFETKLIVCTSESGSNNSIAIRDGGGELVSLFSFFLQKLPTSFYCAYLD